MNAEGLLVGARTVANCPYREALPDDKEGGVAVCRWAAKISGVQTDELCRVRPDMCQACCREPLPDDTRINPYAASVLYHLSRGVIAAGGMPGCTLDQASKLKELARQNLAWAPAVKLRDTERANPTTPCFYLGSQTGDRPCTSCRGEVRLKVYQCLHEAHGSTTLRECARCQDYELALTQGAVQSWAVGLTTAPRSEVTLGRTLRSLERAGWRDVSIFAEPGVGLPRKRPGLRIVRRTDKLGAWPNWLLGLQELMMLHPHAHAYLICQDDVVFCRNAREYLERSLWPTARLGVVSLFCPRHRARYDQQGFQVDNEGWGSYGALAYVFPNAAARALLRHREVVNHRQRGPDEGLRNVDSVVGQWCLKSGLDYHVHHPSLAQHIGDTSTLYPTATNSGRRHSSSFPGEKFDALKLLTAVDPAPVAGPAVPAPVRARLSAPVTRPQPTFGVVVTCHAAYVPLLVETLATIEAQSLAPVEKVLVLDNCEATAPDGWTILHGSWGNPNPARNLGWRQCRAEWIVFWDADDPMPTDYLAAQAENIQTGPLNLAISYPIQLRGHGVQEAQHVMKLRVSWDYWRQRENPPVCTASAWRREALETVGGWVEAVSLADDGNLALRLTAYGWSARLLPDPVVRASRHELGHRSIPRGKRDHTDAFWHSHSLAIVTIHLGRRRNFEDWVRWLAEAELPQFTSLHVVDSSGDAAFAAELGGLSQRFHGRFGTIAIHRWRTERLPADLPRNHYLRGVEVAEDYSRVFAQLSEDLVLTLEDDTVPPLDGVRRLHEHYKPHAKIGAVAGVYESARNPGYIAGSTNLDRWISDPLVGFPEVPVKAGWLPGGCTLFANWALKRCLPLVCRKGKEDRSSHNWDNDFSRKLRQHGYELILDGRVRCAHNFHPSPV